jgi:glycosyltransferase involved in cell wall biosynthesis
MQILHLISGLNSGGAEGVLFKLIKHDKKNTHHVIAFSGGFYLNVLKKNNIDIHIIKLKNIFFLVNFLKLVFFIRKSKADVIQSWMYHADFITILLKIFLIKKKIYWNLRNTVPSLKFSSLSSLILSKICSIFSNLIPEKIIACANSVSLQHQKIGYSKNKIKVIFNGFDSKNFKKNQKNREKLRTKLKIKKKDFLIGCFARYHPQKSHETLINGYSLFSKSYKNSKLLLVGENIPKKLSARDDNLII